MAKMVGSLLILYTAYLKAISVGESYRNIIIQDPGYWSLKAKWCYLLIIGENCPNSDKPGQTERASLQKEKKGEEISL